MRLAVLSDIHGNLPALEAVRADAARAGATAFVNLGDIASGPLWPADTLDALMREAWPTLAGNHERQVLAGAAGTMRLSDTDRRTLAALSPAHLAWLATLPASLRLDDDLMLCHGTPHSDLHYLLETVDPLASDGLRAATDAEVSDRLGAMSPAVTLQLCGHSHLPRDRALPGGLRVVNPGSVGLPAYDDDHPHAHRVQTGSPHARYALVERGPAGWQVSLCAVAYDHEAAARRAQAAGRGDWADALRTGCVGRLEAEALAAVGAA